jgi:pyruvate,water dikinase
VRSVTGGAAFLAEFRRVMENALDLANDTTRLADRPDLILRSVLELARATERPHQSAAESAITTVATLEQRLLAAVGPARREEALETLELAKLSWRLRDNDNLLLSRVESQLIRALEVAAHRLTAAGRLEAGVTVSAKVAELVIAALRDRSGAALVLPVATAAEPVAVAGSRAETPRQLTGQPASAGLATGKVRCVRRTEDLGRFQAGEVLVCDAIQPMMTHLVPLACAVVERRGGMLIHGAIIARELGIPCVNGVPDAVELLSDGQVVTVDGYLGIVTVGPPDFDLELSARR